MRRNREKLFNKRPGPKTPKVDKAKSPKAKGKKVSVKCLLYIERRGEIVTCVRGRE